MSRYSIDPDSEARWGKPFFGREKGTGSLGQNRFCCYHPLGGTQYGTYAGSIRFHGRRWNWENVK